MPLFLVIALQTSTSAVDAAVEAAYPGSSYKIEAGKWVVRAEDLTISRELGARLGIREKESHLIVPIKGHSGRSKPDLWEWLSTQSAKTDA